MNDVKSVEKPKILSAIEFSEKHVVFEFIILFFLMVMILQPSFFQPVNLITIFQQSTIIGMLTFGMVFVMIAEGGGAVDLSVGAVMSLSASLFILRINAGGSLVGTLVVCLLAGVAIGILNGILTITFRLPQFIGTLCSMYIAFGIENIFAEGRSVYLSSDQAREKVIILYNNVVGKIALPIIITIVVCFFLYLLLNKSSFGLRLYAIGFNSTASQTSGIAVRKYKYIAYIASGLLAAFAGILLCSRMTSSTIHMGEPMLMQAIAAAFIGTSASSDGRPTVIGCLFGSFLYQAIANAMIFLGLSYEIIEFLTGVVIVFIVVFSSYSFRQKAKSAQ